MQSWTASAERHWADHELACESGRWIRFYPGSCNLWRWQFGSSRSAQRCLVRRCPSLVVSVSCKGKLAVRCRFASLVLCGIVDECLNSVGHSIWLLATCYSWRDNFLSEYWDWQRWIMSGMSDRLVDLCRFNSFLYSRSPGLGNGMAKSSDQCQILRIVDWWLL